jgi:hypothetical protein
VIYIVRIVLFLGFFSRALLAQESLYASDVAFVVQIVDREVINLHHHCRRFVFSVDVKQHIFGDPGSKKPILIGDNAPLPVGVKALVFAIELEGKELVLARKCFKDRKARIFQTHYSEDSVLLVSGRGEKQTVSVRFCSDAFHKFISQTDSKAIARKVATVREGCEIVEFNLGQLIDLLISRKNKAGFIGPTGSKD